MQRFCVIAVVVVVVCLFAPSANAQAHEQPDFLPHGILPLVVFPPIKGAKLQPAPTTADVVPLTGKEISQIADRASLYNYQKIEYEHLTRKLDTNCGAWGCINNGNCVKGVCHCFPGWKGTHCHQKHPSYNASQRTESFLHFKYSYHNLSKSPTTLEDFVKMYEHDTQQLLQKILGTEPAAASTTKPRNASVNKVSQQQSTKSNATVSATQQPSAQPKASLRDLLRKITEQPRKERSKAKAGDAVEETNETSQPITQATEASENGEAHMRESQIQQDNIQEELTVADLINRSLEADEGDEAAEDS